jgi:phosphoserine phosphatase
MRNEEFDLLVIGGGINGAGVARDAASRGLKVALVTHMNWNPDPLINELKKRRPKGRAIAAFDADGTLWNTDLGEALFDYQIKHKLIPLPPDPWGHYHHMQDTVSKRAAYLWLAQINKGLPITTIRTWAKTAVDELHPVPIFEEQRKIIRALQELGVEIFIVTSSIQWAVAPASHLFGIPEDHVLGIETEVVDGIVTEKQKGVLTFREGKIQALLAATNGAPPYFSAGNTEGDQFLLEAATDVKMVVAAALEGSQNYESERRMVQMAKTRGWFLQDHLSKPSS